jgi:starch synthase
LRLLFLSAELAPIAQSGGLGDAVSGLAHALRARGHEVTCALPGYRSALESPHCSALVDAGDVAISLPEGELEGRWRAGTFQFEDGVELELRLLDIPELFDRDGLYGDASGPFPDEALRFASFGRASAALAVELAPELAPDVVVAHDWHSALAPCLLRELHDDAAREIALVQVVHNGAYQGRFEAGAMAFTGLPPELFSPEGLEFYGDLCLLKGGLMWADEIVAVSPTYAQELRIPRKGDGLEGVYEHRRQHLSGITNGIDTSRFNPATDDALVANFEPGATSGKDLCRAALLDELELDAPPHGRLLAAIGRFATQKGWDVLAGSIEPLIAKGATLVLLGDGDPAIASRLSELRARYPGQLGLRIGWDEPFARRLYAGADCALIPSRFEPCGLVQLLSQRYGALPVGTAVGGLVDTIVDGSTGILFEPLGPQQLVAAVDRAAELYEQHGAAALRETLLALDVSWRHPAQHWEQLLERAVRGIRGSA